MKVLLAIDGSQFSGKAIEACCDVFGGLDTNQIRIISAAEPVLPPAEPFAVSAVYIQQIDDAALKQATDVVSSASDQIRLRLNGSAGAISTTVVLESPAQAIVTEAENWQADVIVIGSHGYGFWRRAVMGSVSSQVVHHAPCSVYVVKTGTALKESRNGADRSVGGR